MKVIICGANGRMGRELVKEVVADPELTLVGGVVKENDGEGQDLGDLALISKTGVIATTDLESIINAGDLIIDFSMPESSISFSLIAAKYKIPYLSGVTGYSDSQMAEIQAGGSNSVVFHSGNMSLGINVLIKLAQMAARLMPAYDIDLIDVHHNKKIDAPSGTAKMIVKAVEENSNGNEVMVSSIRTGDFFGEHQIRFSGFLESLTISHQAQSRSIFVLGALKVAKWLIKQRPGFYTMNDMLI